MAFAGFSLVAVVADHSTVVFMARYARAIAAAILAMIALTSLVFTPFTEQYARESCAARVLVVRGLSSASTAG